MAFDGMITKKIVSELKQSILNGKVNKIFEPNKNEIILGIYANGNNYALTSIISSDCYRIHLTTQTKINPMQAPNFCMLLRKYLIGSRIKDISSVGLERIIFIDFEAYNELNDIVSRRLVIELMGKHSNIILLNENNCILDSLRHLDISSGSYRDISPAHFYVLPTSDKLDFCTITCDDFVSAIADSNSHILNTPSIEEEKCIPLSSLLPDLYTGFSKTFILSTIERLSISDTDYTIPDILNCFAYLKNILDNLNSSSVSCVFYHNDYTLSSDFTSSTLQTNFFLDDFYFAKETKALLLQYRNNLLKLVLSHLKKISKKINGMNQKLKECEQMDTCRIYGELITSHLYEINNNINTNSIDLPNYYDNNKILTIPLDKSISPSYNAKKYFKKYQKLKNTLSIVSEQKLQAKQELDYLESIIYELESSNTTEEIDDIYKEMLENGMIKETISKKSTVKKNKVKNAKEEYEPITYNIDGFTLYVGKNNKQNDYISTKLGKNEDIWFHVQDARGSHCVLKSNGSQVSEETIVECSKIAAFYSKSKLSSNVPVDYCFIKHVKKPSGSKPGMVIFTNNKTVFVNPKG